MGFELLTRERRRARRRSRGPVAAATLVALVASVLSIVVATTDVSAVEPDTAIVNTSNDAWLSMRDFTAETRGWQERTSQFNFLVRHQASESVTGVKIDLNYDGDFADSGVDGGNSCETGVCGNETRTSGITVTRLGQGGSVPGTTVGSYYSLVQTRGTFQGQAGFAGSDRQQSRPVRAAVTMNTGDTPSVSATTWLSSYSNAVGPQDYPVPTNIPDAIDNTIYRPNSSIDVNLTCDDIDGSGSSDGACEDTDYRWRRITDGLTTNANGTGNTTASTEMDVCGDNCNQTKPYATPAMSGRWILETRFRQGGFDASQDCENHNDLYQGGGHGCWFYLGVYTVEDSADPPAPALAANTTRPNTGEPVTLTASSLMDGPGSGTPYGTLGNWNGECFDNIDWTNSKGSYSQSATFNINWGSGRPTCGLTDSNTFSVRYTQTINATMFGTLRTEIGKDDRSFMYVTPPGGAKTLCYPGQTSNTVISGNCPITPGANVLTFEYADNSGDASAQFAVLGFNNSDDRQGIQVVDFDVRSTPGNSADGTYDARYVSGNTSAPYAGFASNQQAHVQPTAGLAPGLYSSAARSCDTGVTICGDLSGSAVSATAQFRVNAPPTVASPAVSAQRGQTTNFVLGIGDVDETATPFGGQTSYTSTATGTGVALSGLGGGTYTCSAPINSSATDGTATINCSVTLAANTPLGARTIAYTATDNNLGVSASGTATINVQNTAPGVTNKVVPPSVFPGVPATPINLVAGATDLNGDTLTYSIVTPPAKGTLTGCTGTAPTSCVYTPNAPFAAPRADSFTFKANDGVTDSNIGAVSITIDNRPPVADDQTVVAEFQTAAPVTLSGTDPDLDPLTYSVIAAPANGVVTCSAPGAASCTYTPNAGFRGTDSFQFQAGDGFGGIDVGQVVVRVGVGAVAGQVTGNDTLAGVAGVEVRLLSASSGYTTSVFTDGLGNYVIPNAAASAAGLNYTLRFVHPDYKDEYLGQVPSSGTQFTVTTGGTATQNFVMRRIVKVTGNVSSGPLGPLPGVIIRVLPVGDPVTTMTTQTDAAGNYSITELLPGSYEVQVQPVNDNRVYLQWLLGSFTRDTANQFVWSAGDVVTALDAVLVPRLSTISGQVTADAGGAPIADVEVRAYLPAPYGSSKAVRTDANGNYSITGLPPGSHQVKITPLSTAPFRTEWFNNKATQAASDLVVLAEAGTETINVGLAAR